MEFTRPSPNGIFNICNPYGIKLLTRLLLGSSILNEHKFKHGFNDIINPICFCGGDVESINHLFLHCLEYCEAKQTLFGNIRNIDKEAPAPHEARLALLDTNPVFQSLGDKLRVSNTNYCDNIVLLKLNIISLEILFISFG